MRIPSLILSGEITSHDHKHTSMITREYKVTWNLAVVETKTSLTSHCHLLFQVIEIDSFAKLKRSLTKSVASVVLFGKLSFFVGISRIDNVHSQDPDCT